MAYEYVLADLLAKNEGALGALFLDDRGETVDLVCADSSPYQMKIVGAYLGIHLRQVEEFLRGIGDGEPRWLHVEKDTVHYYAVPLPDGYSLVLVQRAPALSAHARRTLEAARDSLYRELFATG
jgi:hypothetical protein